jgi:hypothetical protein
MNEAEKARAQAICHEEEMARAKFEAQLRAHRDKTARLRAQRLARQEASWLERRKSTMAVIRAGLADLREKTTRMRTTRSAKVGSRGGFDVPVSIAASHFIGTSNPKPH